MLTDPITLYKLMTLYMLKQVNFPLTNSQLTSFFLDHEYTTYFTLQQALNELLEAGLLKKEASHNSTRYEITREGECGAGIPDVDVALTTRELGQMIQRAGLLFAELPEEEFDPALGIATGAGHIFGASGGVMEAALRTASELLTGKELEKVEFQEVRGAHGIKEAAYEIAGRTVRVCVLSGTANAGQVLEDIRSGKRAYDFIEIMACPGGCVNGGGQPLQPSVIRNFRSVSAMRAGALYQEDQEMPLRKSHKSPLIQEVYEHYLDQPGSQRAHQLLHTCYTDRSGQHR